MAVATIGLESGHRRELASGLHPAAWLAWLTAVSIAALLTSNPLYLSLALLSAATVFVAVPDSTKKRMMWPVVVIGLALSTLSIPLNVLTGSVGATELFSMPTWRSPTWFGGVVLGGSITGEAGVTAIGRALTIGTVVVAAAAFNASIDHFRLVRLAPRALAHAMLVLTIGIVLMPQAVEHGRRVVEARRLRGRGERGLRALPAVLLPILAGALERSVQRAESLEARGFGAGVRSGGWRMALVGVAGVGLCAWGGFAQFYYGGLWPVAVVMLGIVLALCSMVRTGGQRTERLRRDDLSLRDSLVICAGVVSALLVLYLRAVGAGDISYLAYPEVSIPAFHSAGAAAFALLLLPALLVGDEERP